MRPVCDERSPKSVGVSAIVCCIERLVDGEGTAHEADDRIGVGYKDVLRLMVVTDAHARAVFVDAENDA